MKFYELEAAFRKFEGAIVLYSHTEGRGATEHLNGVTKYQARDIKGGALTEWINPEAMGAWVTAKLENR